MTARALTLTALVAAAAFAAILMFRVGGEQYEIKARFENAGQMVRGGLVQIGGKRAGTVTALELAGDNQAEITMKIDPKFAPLPKGTHATIRQFGLSGPASRYVDLRAPSRQEEGDIPDGTLLTTESTTGNVDLDEIFSIFDKRTRRGLSGVFRGSARQYRDQGPAANEGWFYLDPALVASSRLFAEVNRSSPDLERFVQRSSRLVSDVAERRRDLSGLVSNLADTTGAISRPRGALADAISQLPPFLRRANSTYVNLRAALDDVDPLVNEAKPVAKRLRPYAVELRKLAEDAQPTVRDLAKVIRRPGSGNDLVELSRATVPLRNIAIGPVSRNGKEREGAFPATTEALKGATPRVAFARPYAVDLTGWFDDFSHTGYIDALGASSRTGTHVNAFTFKNGVASPIAPALRAESFRALATLGQNNRCPGASERDPGDGSTPFRPSPDFNCDPSQVPPGR